MVRKWSYLEQTVTLSPLNSLKQIPKLYNFKVFRKTTRFKKYNRGITRMVRKNYARRKHQTNWLNLSYISKSWVLNYLSLRQFERFYSALGRFNVSAYSSDVNVFFLKLPTLLNKNGINILTCSRSVLNKHINYTDKAVFLRNHTQHARSAYVQTSNHTDVLSSLEIYPSIINIESSFYSPDELKLALSRNEITNQLTYLESNVFNHSLNIVLSSYNVLILLTLLNTNRP